MLSSSYKKEDISYEDIVDLHADSDVKEAEYAKVRDPANDEDTVESHVNKSYTKFPSGTAQRVKHIQS